MNIEKMTRQQIEDRMSEITTIFVEKRRKGYQLYQYSYEGIDLIKEFDMLETALNGFYNVDDCGRILNP